jgi:uncharacterized membrane protein YsdA (DUF1294 family)
MLIHNQLVYFFSILIFLVVVNLLSFIMMLVDKARAHKAGAERISEGMLFFLAAGFGSIGVYVGMFIFRHKTQKWYFLIGIPLLIIENIAFLYVFYLFLLNRLVAI